MDSNTPTWDVAKARFLAALEQSGTALTMVEVDHTLVIEGVGGHRVVCANWIALEKSRYSIEPLALPADVALMLPLQPPLVVLSEDMQPHASLPLVPASEMALAECLKVLERFKDKPLEDLRQIFVQWGVLSLWQLALGPPYNSNWLK